MSFQYGNSVSLIWKRLKKGEYTVKPFPVFKRWEITSDSSSLNYSGNRGISVLRVLYPENHKYFGGVANISSSNYVRVMPSQSIDPKLLWYYLDHNYYTRHDKSKYPTVFTDDSRDTFLAESSSMIIIPQDVFGEGVKRNSFEVSNLHATSASLRFVVVDDGDGNLVDTSINTASFKGTTDLQLYVGFNEKYREYGMTNKLLHYVLDFSPFESDVRLVNHKRIEYRPGIPTTDTSQSTGTCAYFYGSYLQIPEKDKFNYGRAADFSIGFWVSCSVSQSLSTEITTPIVDKKSFRSVDTENLRTRMVSSSLRNEVSSKYPFDISLTNETHSTPGRLLFKRSTGNEYVELISTVAVTGSWHHVICQKSSSTYQLWIDGQLDVTASFESMNSVMNDSILTIASNGTSSFNGYIDEFRIYDSSLSSAQITSLATNTLANGSAYQTNRIGNIFYKTGIAVVSDPRPKYHNAFLGRTGNQDYENTSYGYSGSFRGTTTLFEHEVICKLRRSEFNFTQNQSVRKNGDPSSQVVADYATGSLFNPYITTIGLYNDNHQLVAVAKLASPLEKRDDVDMNIIIRFDS